MKKLIIYIFLVGSLCFGQVVNVFAVTVYDDYKIWHHNADMTIYNNTAATVSIPLDEGSTWKESTGVYDDPDPIAAYSARIIQDMDARSGSDQKGMLVIAIQEEGKPDLQFAIDGTNIHSSHYFVLTMTVGGKWQDEGDSTSGAKGISEEDDGIFVAQIYNDKYVVTIMSDNNNDTDSLRENSGNSKVIVFISNNEASRFGQSPANSRWPNSWTH